VGELLFLNRLRLAGSPPPTITLGNTDVAAAGLSVSADTQQGFGVQAAQSFTGTRMFLRGSVASGLQTFNYRLCIYAATSATVWSGLLLGQTDIVSSLDQDETKELALLSPVNFVLSSWYALTIQAAAPGGLMGRSAASPFGDRFFADAFTDGPAATAGASGLNSGSTRCMYVGN
jgi:hypothetical protein